MLLSAAAAWTPVWLAPQFVAVTEGVVGDSFWRAGARTDSERRIVLVDIDEKSLNQVGPWPWSRGVVADLSEKLAQSGALVQAYDITFSGPRIGDADLARAWALSPVIAAQLFSLDAAVTPLAGAVSGALAVAQCPPFAPAAYGHYGITSALLSANLATGHITPRVELDGVVRKLPALICSNSRAYANLAMAMLWRAAQAPLPDASAAEQVLVPDWQWHTSSDDHSRWVPFLAPAAWLTSKSLPGVVVPVDARGDVRVPYKLTKKAFASISASDVLNRSADLSLLKGAIVMVGATAFGIGDIVATPHASVASGMEVHAQTLVGLLDNRLPYTPALWPWFQALLVLSFSVCVLLVATSRGAPAKRLPLLGLALALACVALSAWALLTWSLWLPWFVPAFFAVLSSVSLATIEHALARAQRERLSAHLVAYLPSPMAHRLMTSDPSGALQMERLEVSVLVADIRNFSAFATHCPPEQAAVLLHAFCCIAVEVVERHGGILENVIGDSVLAVWSHSPKCSDHSGQALAAARELLKATQTLLASSRPLDEYGPVQPLALGIGLESGAAIVGSFGPSQRRAHAALGEPVSVANRIQQMTADLSVPVLVGPHMASLLPTAGVGALGDFLLEGLGKHYRLFAPTGWADWVAVDPNWAASAAPNAERQVEGVEWSRWGEPQRSGASPSRPLRALSPFDKRSA